AVVSPGGVSRAVCAGCGQHHARVVGRGDGGCGGVVARTCGEDGRAGGGDDSAARCGGALGVDGGAAAGAGVGAAEGVGGGVGGGRKKAPGVSRGWRVVAVGVRGLEADVDDREDLGERVEVIPVAGVHLVPQADLHALEGFGEIDEAELQAGDVFAGVDEAELRAGDVGDGVVAPVEQAGLQAGEVGGVDVEPACLPAADF